MNVYSYLHHLDRHERKQIERMIIQKSKEYGVEVTLLNGNYIRFRVKDIKGEFKKMLEGEQINLNRRAFYDSSKSNVKQNSWMAMEDNINLFYHTFMIKGVPIIFEKMN